MKIVFPIFLAIALLLSGSTALRESQKAVIAEEVPAIEQWEDCKVFADVELFHMRGIVLCENLREKTAGLILYNGEPRNSAEIGRAWNIRLLPSEKEADRYDWGGRIIAALKKPDGSYCISDQGVIPTPRIYADKSGEDEGLEFNVDGKRCKATLRYRHPWYKPDSLSRYYQMHPSRQLPEWVHISNMHSSP